MTTAVKVELGPRSYEVRIVSEPESGAFGAFAREALEARWAGRGCRAALIVTENNLGWVVTPGMSEQLAAAIRAASVSTDRAMAERVVAAAKNFSSDRALSSYAALVRELLGNPDRAERIS